MFRLMHGFELCAKGDHCMQIVLLLQSPSHILTHQPRSQLHHRLQMCQRLRIPLGDQPRHTCPSPRRSARSPAAMMESAWMTHSISSSLLGTPSDALSVRPQKLCGTGISRNPARIQAGYALANHFLAPRNREVRELSASISKSFVDEIPKLFRISLPLFVVN